MKNQKKTIIILLGVLVLLVAAVFGVRALTEESETEAEPEAAEEYTVLFSADAAEISAFSYTHEGEELKFEKNGDAWTYAGDPAMPLDPEKIAEMLTALSEIRAYKQIDTDEDFGFGQKEISVTAGSTCHFAVGNVNPQIGKAYLLTDESVIYTTDSALSTSFDSGIEELLLADEMPAIDAGSVTNLSVENGEHSYEVAMYDERELYYWFSYILENAAGKTPLDSDAATELIGKAAEPYLFCEDYAPAQEELSAAGFDDPAVVTLTYSETDGEGETVTKTYQLFFGSTYTEAENTRRYVMLEDSDMLFYVSDAAVSTLLVPDLAELAPAYLAQMDFYELTEFSFALNGEQHTALMEDTDGETLCTLDGQNISPAFVESFFLDLTLVTSEGGYSEELPAGEPAVSAYFKQQRDSGAYEYTLSIYEYNENFCIAVFSGRQDAMLISIRDFNRLSDSLAELKENAVR